MANRSKKKGNPYKCPYCHGLGNKHLGGPCRKCYGKRNEEGALPLFRKDFKPEYGFNMGDAFVGDTFGIMSDKFGIEREKS